jgi:hypothetical protein
MGLQSNRALAYLILYGSMPGHLLIPIMKIKDHLQDPVSWDCRNTLYSALVNSLVLSGTWDELGLDLLVYITPQEH